MPDRPDIRSQPLDLGPLTFDLAVAGPSDGPLVMLLHGFPQTGAAWRGVMPGLAGRGYHVIAPDQRGYSPGARPTRTRDYHVDRLVDDALEIADRMGADRIHLVGHDWGGIVAWALASRRPDRLASLSVLSTPHPRAYAEAVFRSTQLLHSYYIALFDLPVISERLLGARDGLGLRRALVCSGLPEEAADQYTAAMVRGGGLTPALRWYRALRPASARVGPITVPTLYVWSDGDMALGRVAAEATAGHVSGPYRFEVLAGASHWLPETRPREVTELLLAHISAHP